MDSPAAASPRSSSRKRTASSLALDGEVGPEVDEPQPKKKRAPRSTAAEKQAKKLARMERNRLAAQVSRDKKKQQAEFLEARIAELEAQVGGNGSSPSSSTASFTPGLPLTPASYTLALPALAAAPDALVERLQQENESLRTELALEKLQSQLLQIRLSALESKFGRLEQLLTSAGSTTTTAAPPMVKQEDALEPTMTTVGSTETDSSRLVAREDDFSLPRKLSHPSFPPSPASTSTRSSVSTSASLPTLPRPSLHQILSSIRISAPPTPSRRLGPTGRAPSTSLPSRRRRSLSSPRASPSSTSSSSCGKTPRALRLRLSTRR